MILGFLRNSNVREGHAECLGKVEATAISAPSSKSWQTWQLLKPSPRLPMLLLSPPADFHEMQRRQFQRAPCLPESTTALHVMSHYLGICTRTRVTACTKNLITHLHLKNMQQQDMEIDIRVWH